MNDKLASLSLQVARQVDRRLKDHPWDPQILTNFGHALIDASVLRSEEQPTVASLNSDPITTEVFLQAIQETSHEPIPSMQKLAELTARVVQPLIVDASAMTPDELRGIKAFCLALHKSLMAQKLPMRPDRDGSSFEDVLTFVG